MKIGIVSDTHSNIVALDAVLEHMKHIGVDLKVHLGDIVGYGPRPSETLARTIENFEYIVKGNHDKASYDENERWTFNPIAKEAILWTSKQMSSDEIDVLKGLGYTASIGDALFTHGSPDEPFDYILDTYDAKKGFSNKDFEIAFVGHTHVPFVWKETDNIVFDRPVFNMGTQLNNCGFDSEFKVKLTSRTIVNVGSVGQPRDGDNRATYAIYDVDNKEVTIYKVPYRVDFVVGNMQRLGINDKLSERLIHGR